MHCSAVHTVLVSIAATRMRNNAAPVEEWTFVSFALAEIGKRAAKRNTIGTCNSRAPLSLERRLLVGLIVSADESAAPREQAPRSYPYPYRADCAALELCVASLTRESTSEQREREGRPRRARPRLLHWQLNSLHLSKFPVASSSSSPPSFVISRPALLGRSSSSRRFGSRARLAFNCRLALYLSALRT